MSNPFNATFERAKEASHKLLLLSDEKKSEILLTLADRILQDKEGILNANSKDLARMDQSSPLYDRLLLNTKRLEDIASDMRHVAQLPSPLNRIIYSDFRPNGLNIKRITVPFGVVGLIYEARPNVTFDVFSLCFKSGNVCILKGGSDADNSNRAAVDLIHQVLIEKDIDPHIVELLPPSHEATKALLEAVGHVDLCIPRGGKNLIRFVRENAKVPVIETGAGVVSLYFDKTGDLEIGKPVILNAKTRRVSVCNALDSLLIHQDRLSDLPELCRPLQEKNVRLYADVRSFQSLFRNYPSHLLFPATSDTFGTEYMDYAMSIATVNSVQEAIAHIEQYDSGHSESIISEDEESIATFQQQVDAACIYVNTPTSFTDGAQFGLGAEIGISTQKLGPRGPMGLEELTTYKWLISGHGQIRP